MTPTLAIGLACFLAGAASTVLAGAVLRARASRTASVEGYDV